MTNFLRTILMAVAIAGGAPALAESSPVVGSWKVLAKTPMGDFEGVLTFAKNGDAYSVDIQDAPMPGAEGPPPEDVISDVVVDGNAFSFKRSLTTPQGPLDLTYTGKVEGDSLAGEANSSFGPVPISGTRAPAS
jgi:hypothetical protein